VLFQAGDIVEHGEEAEAEALEGDDDGGGNGGAGGFTDDGSGSLGIGSLKGVTR